jgi:hypothetical protein
LKRGQSDLQLGLKNISILQKSPIFRLCRELRGENIQSNKVEDFRFNTNRLNTIVECKMKRISCHVQHDVAKYRWS